MYTLQILRERILLVLLALLPLHALLVTVFTKLVMGANQAPLGMFAIWKEAVLAVILLMSVGEFYCMLRRNRYIFSVDILDGCIVAFVFLGVIVSAFQELLPSAQFFYGVKYDVVPLIVFLLFRRLPWSSVFFTKVLHVMLGVGVVVALYGIISFFLPESFFHFLGYADLHSLYVPNAPLAPFQYIGGLDLRRVQSTFSGPNQLGLWLLLPLSGLLGILAQRRAIDIRHGMLVGLFCTVLVLTFSRAAWIGAGAVFLMHFWRWIRQYSVRVLSFILLSSVILIIGLTLLFPSVFVRIASTRGHIEHPLQAIESILEHPFGLGFGAAGPASNRVRDACVYLEEGADASWAEVHQDLCVFVGSQQVQPALKGIGTADSLCHCPFLPENWYLQIGVELGVLGMVLYLLLTILLIRRMWYVDVPYQWILSAFLGISLAALFLHAWEDAAVAYSTWIILAALSSHSLLQKVRSN